MAILTRDVKMSSFNNYWVSKSAIFELAGVHGPFGTVNPVAFTNAVEQL
jgi:hypothetical protein